MKIRETHKVVVFGAGGVGKTSLVCQFMEGFFSSTYKPTVEDYYRHTIQLPDGIFHTVEILDTSGTHYFPAMRELSIRSGRGFILVFSVDSLQSFHEAVSLWELVTKIRGVGVPLVLVGNKSDLEEVRQVSLDMIEQTKGELMNNCPYIETSAKFNLNVGKLFTELLSQAKSLDGTGTPDLKRNRKLSRRLSSFSSLPNITLIRRKSSGNSNKMGKNANNGINGVANANGMNVINGVGSKGLMNGVGNGVGNGKGVGKGVNDTTPASTPTQTPVKAVNSKKANVDKVNGVEKVNGVHGMQGMLEIEGVFYVDGGKIVPDQKCVIL